MDSFATRLPVLMGAVSCTKGPILELGCGNYSTPILHEVAEKSLRYVLTLDCDQEWMSRFTGMRSAYHSLVCVGMTDGFKKTGVSVKEDFDVWQNCTLIDNEPMWSVVLVDHRPGERRKDEIVRLKDRAYYIVVHDSQEPGYGYEPVLSQFKYRYDYKRYDTWTTVVSNFARYAEN